MNYSINELRKYGVKLSEEQLVEGLINLGHEVEEVIDHSIKGLVIGEVLTCEPHPNSDKLSLTVVDLGTEQVQIVCGAPNVRAGLKVIVATVGTYFPHLDLEIKPTSIRDQVSNGMICSIGELGFNKRVLNDKDSAGICELPDQSPVGTDANSYLGIDDKILDVSLTADRGDCQNYMGIVGDLVAYTSFNFPQMAFTNELTHEHELNFQGDIKRDIDVQALNTIYYSTQEITNVTVEESDIQTQIFLMKHGVKPQNNIVDFSNYCLLTFGIPTHTFDSDQVNGKVTVRKTSDKEQFVGLDGNTYDLVADTLVICDEEKIIALAGVMGSNQTKITSDTKNVLLELAIFDPTEVRLGAKNLGFKTEASIRYEKGVNYAAINHIRNYFLKLKGDHHLPYVGIDNFKEKANVAIDYQRCNRVLGTNISSEEIKTILKLLNFNLVKEDQQSVVYAIPAHRHDIEFHNDLVEEVIRVYGIDKIVNAEVLTTFNRTTKITSDNSLRLNRIIEQNFLSYGLDQVVTYSLTSKDNCSLFTNQSHELVELMHPISNERVCYRQSLVNSLIETAKYNLARQQKQSAIFEIGDTYYLENGEVIQARKISGLVVGEFQNQYMGAKRKYDFYDLKAVLEVSLSQLVGNLEFKQVDLQIDNLNPYASSSVSVKGEYLGYIAAVAPSFIKKIKSPMFVFELDFNKILQLANEEYSYQPISDAPISERDITITTEDTVTFDQLLEVFDNVNYVNDVKLVEIYKGENIAANHQAYTLKIGFGLLGQTLTSQMVDEQVAILVENIKRNNYLFKE